MTRIRLCSGRGWAFTEDEVKKLIENKEKVNVKHNKAVAKTVAN